MSLTTLKLVSRCFFANKVALFCAFSTMVNFVGAYRANQMDNFWWSLLSFIGFIMGITAVIWTTAETYERYMQALRSVERNGTFNWYLLAGHKAPYCSRKGYKLAFEKFLSTYKI